MDTRTGRGLGGLVEAGGRGVMLMLLGFVGCSAEPAPFSDARGVTSKTERSICGPTIEWQDVESYDGALGLSAELLRLRQGAVGLIPRHCTGTLVAYNLLLTAGHCIVDASHAESLTVQFNYQNDPAGSPRPVDEYSVVELLEHRNDEVHGGAVDYALLRVAGSPGHRWGVTPVSAAAPRVGDALAMVQHPAGLPKVVDFGTLARIGSSTLYYGDLDTLGGSSGAGLLDGFGNLIGVHEQGDCSATGGANRARRVHSIIQAGSVLGGLDELWLGRTERAWTRAATAPERRSDQPIPGDFDGDGQGDVLWYDTQRERVDAWFGQGDASFVATEGAFTIQPAVYAPAVGDFDGDGRDDVLWYKPSAAEAVVWYGSSERSFAAEPLVVAPAYQPVAGDFDGDGSEDLLWYGGGERLDAVWYGSAERAFSARALDVSTPWSQLVVGDFDGDRRDDVFWYGPGEAADGITWGRPERTFEFDPREVAVHSRLFAGDFDGDGLDDLFWYGPAGDPDAVWFAEGAGRFLAVAVDVAGVFTPVVGRFDANASTDIYWYRPG